MPSKLRKAIGAVKDHTSIGLAKVTNNNSSNLDIAVLKATTHEEVPIDARYIDEILLLTSASKTYAAACAQAIAKRIGRTRNWIVALKSLMLVLRIFQDGDPHFPREVLHCMKRGSKILNLSCFRDDSNSSPWDYTAFVRTFALYLDERLDCFLMGKLQRRAVNKERDSTYQRRQRANEHVCDMKPPMLLDRISYWQRLLDRAIAARPTGAAKTNRLVQLSLHSVVWESFDLYRDISDGLALLLDRFFHLQYQSCVDAFQTCIKASKQFEELCAFYTLCKSIGVGRTSEYPSVQKISEELIETLREFLKDQASFPTSNGRPVASQLLLPAPPTTASSSGRLEASEQSETSERTSLEDLVSVTDDAGTSPSISIDRECCLEQVEKQPQLEDLVCVNDVGTTPSVSIDQGGLAGLDQLLFDEMTQKEELQSPSVSGLPKGEREGWELVLAETARDLSSTQLSSNIAAGGFETSFLDDLYDQASLQQPHSNYSNPFLQDTSGITATSSAAPAIPVVDTFSSFHTFQATPTFCAQNSNEATGTMHIENDPFAPCTPQVRVVDQISDMSTNQQHLLHEQQLWLQHQNKIIARHIS